MRVLLLSSSMGLGGADKQLLSAAVEMRRRGHQVLIVSLTPLGPMGLEARSSGIRTESLEMRRGIPDPRGLVRLASMVRAWKPDVLHSHMVHANLMARALRVLIPIPAVISTIHSVHEGGRFRLAAYRLTNRLVDAMTIISTAAAEQYVAQGTIPRELLRVIPNGVDADRFQDIPPDTRAILRRSLSVERAFVWLAVGRFETPKDYPTMLRAFSKVRDRHPQAVLLLVGRGSLKEETETVMGDLQLGGVHFLGVRQDVPELMSAADGYVMSSAWEGMPTVLLEAAAAGLPIVATGVGGIPEVVREEASGFLVPPRNPDALGLAMLRLMELAPSQRTSMGERGREHVRARYGTHRMVDGWEEVYREVLTRKGLAPAATPVSAPAASAGGDDRPAPSSNGIGRSEARLL